MWVYLNSPMSLSNSTGLVATWYLWPDNNTTIGLYMDLSDNTLVAYFLLIGIDIFAIIFIIAVKRSEAAHNSMTPTLFCLKIKKMPNFDTYHVVIMHNVLLLKVSMV